MAKAEATVEELVSMIERGELRLPEMQRRYVWRAPRVRDLLDSLYRGYPSGAILLWETDEQVPLQDFAVTQEASPYQSTRLLLDGQQRLTSLSAVIRGQEVSVRGRKKPIDILFNLEHPEELSVVTEVEEDAEDDPTGDEADSTDDELQRRFQRMAFVVATRQLSMMPQWVRVSDVFRTDSDTGFLKAAGVTGFEDERYEKYSRRLAKLRGIRKYVYRMDVLERGLSYEEVTEIFVRVNSLGAKLRGSDLALAQITAKWPRSLAIFQEFQERCKTLGFDLDLGIHLKTMVAFATGQSRFQTVGGLPAARLQRAWEEGCEGMEFALNFLRSNTGLDSPVLLSSPFILVALAYLGHKRQYQLSTEEANRLRYWVLVANAKGRYSRGSSETILDQDLTTIRDGGTVEDLIDRLRLQMGRLEIVPEDLEGRTRVSALFKTMFLAFRADGARDWRSNLSISLDHSGSQHRIQFHHIFPRAVLRKAGRSPRDINDIANLSFLSGRTNRAISDQAPAAYLPPLVEKLGTEPFEAQAIPVDPSVLEIDAYDEFLTTRRRRVAERLNRFLE